MRIRIDGCGDCDESRRLVIAMASAGVASRRAGSLAARMAELSVGEGDACIIVSRLGEVARASETIERLLASDPGGEIRLGAFVARFLQLRMMVAGGGCLGLSSVDLPVDFQLARVVAYILCDLISAVEKLGTGCDPDVRIAIERDGGSVLIAVVARDAESGPMWTMTGSEALRRAERLVHGIGGSLTRGFQDGEMLFGIGIPVEDDREDGDE